MGPPSRPGSSRTVAAPLRTPQGGQPRAVGDERLRFGPDGRWTGTAQGASSLEAQEREPDPIGGCAMSLTRRHPRAIDDPGGQAAARDAVTSTGRATTTTAPRARSDEALLLDVGAGDQQAFATLYDHVAGLVYANIRRVLCDTARTDTVAEEAFVEVWRQAPRFDPAQMRAVAWILDLAHRLAEERVRYDASRADAGPGGPRAEPHRSVPATSGARETDGSVSSAFAELTEQQQRAIELASLGVYTHHHIAAQLNTSIETTQILLRDGLVHLRTGLQAREQRY